MFAVIDVCLIAQVSATALAKSLGVDATCVSGSVARMESRLGIDEELKKVVDEIVSAVENSKYQARPLTPSSSPISASKMQWSAPVSRIDSRGALFLC
jgi:hypothetical protein